MTHCSSLRYQTTTQIKNTIQGSMKGWGYHMTHQPSRVVQGGCSPKRGFVQGGRYHMHHPGWHERVG